jgi:heme-degrading monooxygenase HmoA
MYMRLITWEGTKNIDGGIEYLRSTALPLIHQQKGYKGLTASIDRSANTMSILSAWESEADREASDSALGKARDEGSEIIGGSIVVQKLEEVAAEVVNPPKPGCALMVTPFSMDPSKVEENVKFFKDEIAPQIKAAPGFCALRNMVNRSTGEGFVGTLWIDKSAMDKQAEGAARSRRETAAARGITFGEISHREIVLVDMP